MFSWQTSATLVYVWTLPLHMTCSLRVSDSIETVSALSLVNLMNQTPGRH